MALNTGNIDLSSFPPGNVLITVTLDDDAWNAGFRLPTDGYQAVALAIDPPGAPTAPTPVFGQSSWPAGFLMPAVSADQRSVSWTDLESDQNVYEYSIGLQGPGVEAFVEQDLAWLRDRGARAVVSIAGGSVDEYIGAGDPAAGQMYAKKFAYPGHCGGEHCSQLMVPANCTPWCPTHPDCPVFVLNSTTKLGIMIRNYLEPSTDVGPAYGELLYDQVIKFSPK